ncbi:tetratricopeptide repeat protein [Streptomyces sp. NPDC059944]|uniref:tetratricopeptide repeat protein n=1 Tax=unclassified Streptomyces TaxID=2593676 RepID=UPI003647F665
MLMARRATAAAQPVARGGGGMVLWQGNNFTVDGREPTTAEEYYRIGLHCWNGEQYRGAAAHFLGAAADAGHDAAAELLGHIDYVQGRYASAVPRLRRSSGSPRAAYYLASLHQRGCPEAGIRQSYDEAGRWYRAASELGEPEAMLALGDLYLERLLPATRTPAEHALEQFLAAAAREHPYGQYRAAEIYRTLYQDADSAAALYRACVNNPLTGRHALGSMMMLQSQAHLREISATTAGRLQQQRRDAVNPSEPRSDFY